MGHQYFKRPVNTEERSRLRGAGFSTAASTALATAQVVALQTTSTGASVVYTLATPAVGDVLEIQANKAASSSTPFNINAQTSGAFGYVGTTAQDMIQLTTVGDSVRLIAINATEWFVVGKASLTTST